MALHRAVQETEACRARSQELASSRICQSELERAVRSRSKGAFCEAILKLAPRLLQWSLEEPFSETEAEVTGIIYRLTDIFEHGSNAVRLCILKVLLHVYRGHRKRSRDTSNFLLTIARLSCRETRSHQQLVSSVKAVAQDADLTARCLAVRVLGCFAELGANSVDIQCLILEFLKSNIVQEMKAGTFAAGCMAEVSSSFASVCLQEVTDLVNSDKLGENMMADDRRIELLLFLGKLAKISSSDQVDLLLNYTLYYPLVSIKMAALTSLEQILRLNIMHKHRKLAMDNLDQLCSIVSDCGRPRALRLRTLRVITKASTLNKSFISFMEVIALGSDWSVAMQSLSFLVDAVPKLECDIELTTRMGLLLCERVAVARRRDSARCLHLVARLASYCAQSAFCMLESLASIATSLLSEPLDTNGDTKMQDIASSEQPKDTRKLSLICRCLSACSMNLEGGHPRINSIYSQLLKVWELLRALDVVDAIHINFLQAVLAVGSVTGLTATKLLDPFSDRLLKTSRLWTAYKLATGCCLCGQWRLGEQIFGSLSDRVDSEACYFWLKALSQLSSGENCLTSGSGSIVEASGWIEGACRSLEASAQTSRPMEFQRRLLKLRSRMLQPILDLVTLCDSVQRMQWLHGGGDPKLVQHFSASGGGRAVSLLNAFQSLAEDFYKVTSYFPGMDKQSAMVLHGYMLQCSLLAFCTAYAFLGSSSSSSPGLPCLSHRLDALREVEAFVHRRSWRLEELMPVLLRLAMGKQSPRAAIRWSKLLFPTRSVSEVVSRLVELEDSVTSASVKEKAAVLKVVTPLTSKWVLPKYFFKTQAT